VLSDLDASGAMLVLPGKLEVVAAEERAFAAALLEAAQLRARRPTRWRVIQGHGVGGELPCRHGK
jgi:hypothetical protein